MCLQVSVFDNAALVALSLMKLFIALLMHDDSVSCVYIEGKILFCQFAT